jgi:hypothetical protein
MAFEFAKDKRLESGHLAHCVGNKHEVVDVCEDNAAICVYKDTWISFNRVVADRSEKSRKFLVPQTG